MTPQPTTPTQNHHGRLAPADNACMSDLRDGRPAPREHRPSPINSATGASARTLAAILGEIAALYGLSTQQLKQRTRRHDISHPRQHAMAVMRAEPGPDGRPRYSCQQIANYLGAKDHTTVAYGVQAHARRQAAKAGQP